MPEINLLNYTMADSVLRLVWVANEYSERWLGILLLVVICIIILINLAFYDVRSLFMYLGFFMWIISLLAWLSGLIPFLLVIIFLVLGMGSVLLSFLT